MDRLLEVLGRLLEERVSLCDDGDGVDGGDTYPVEFSFEFYPHGNIQVCFMIREGYSRLDTAVATFRMLACMHQVSKIGGRGSGSWHHWHYFL